MPPGRQTVLKKPKDVKTTLIRMIRYLGEYKLIIVLICVLCFVSNILALLGPNLAGRAINAAAAGEGKVDFDKIAYYLKRMLAFYVISSLITIAINQAMIRVSKWVANRMRKDVFDKLMSLPISFFDHNQAGDIISRVSYDVDVISTCLATDIVQILTSIVTVVGSLVMMLTISRILSLVMLFTVPASVGFTAYMRKKTQPRYSKRSKNYGIMNGFVEEMFSGQKTIMAYAHENEIIDRYDKVNNDAAFAYYDAEYYGAIIGPAMGVIGNTGLGLIGVFGSFLYMYQVITLGQISSFVLYSRKFSGPINEISNIINELFSAMAAAERVFELLDTEEEVADAQDAVELNSVRGNVKAEHVFFGYDKNKTIIHDLCMEAPEGKLVAIVGPTGAGKTTIINLLMRFYDVDSGSIGVDDKAVTEYTRGSLRRAYAMVLQDTWLFKGTVYDNIAYGKPDASREKVIEAAKAAHIHGFIMRLPNGYDTIIEEDGGNISKGQKQLLTIARAMLYDARMLILDEATSNVDTDTERRIQEAMRELMKDKTCFVIAHRLSTIENADLILVLDHGDVVEQGTHESLMKAKGFYNKLYMAQFE